MVLRDEKEPKVNFEVVGKRIRTRESSPLVPPVSRNPARDLIVPKASVLTTVESLPVCMSTRRSSKRVPRETIISWCRAPEKLPTIAWVMAVGGCNVRL